MSGDGGTQIITKRALLARIEALEAEVKALKAAPPPTWAPQVIGPAGPWYPVGYPTGAQCWPYESHGVAGRECQTLTGAAGQLRY